VVLVVLVDVVVDDVFLVSRSPRSLQVWNFCRIRSNARAVEETKIEVSAVQPELIQ